MTSSIQDFEARLLAKGRRRARPGAAPRALASQLGLEDEKVMPVLRRWIESGWYEACGDDLLDGWLTDSAPYRVPSFGSFATDGHWSEDRWGHRIFHPRSPGPPSPNDPSDRSS